MKITSTIKSLPNKAYKGINDLGKSTIESCHKLRNNFSKNHFVQSATTKIKNHKETIVGSLVLVALGSIVKLLSTIRNKIKQTKNNKYYN